MIPSEADPIAAHSEAQISGFWRRLVSLVVDVLVLGAAGAVVGYFLFEPLASLGRWAFHLGLAIELTYFGFLNSSLAAGQTLGKRLLGIRVIDRSGSYLPPVKSVFRAAVLCVPFALNGLALPPFASGVATAVLLAVIVFGGITLTVYLYIFNRPTRQSLHDLAVGSYVVEAQPLASPHTEPIWRGHLVAIIICVVAISMAVVLLPRTIPPDFPIESFAAAQRKLETSDAIKIARVLSGETHSTRYVSVSAVVFPRPKSYESMAKQIARDFIVAVPSISEVNKITVSIMYGYDIGISRYYETNNFHWSPSELMKEA